MTGIVAGPTGRLLPWSLSLLTGMASGPVALVRFHVPPSVQITEEAGERLGLTPPRLPRARLRQPDALDRTVILLANGAEVLKELERSRKLAGVAEHLEAEYE